MAKISQQLFCKIIIVAHISKVAHISENLRYIDLFVLQHVFIMEQEEYKREGIDWTEIKFIDNQPLLVSV